MPHGFLVPSTYHCWIFLRWAMGMIWLPLCLPYQSVPSKPSPSRPFPLSSCSCGPSYLDPQQAGSAALLFLPICAVLRRLGAPGLCQPPSVHAHPHALWMPFFSSGQEASSWCIPGHYAALPERLSCQVPQWACHFERNRGGIRKQGNKPRKPYRSP